VCGFDLETNSPADHTKNIGVYNNLFDYEEAALESAGNAVCLQDPYQGPNHGKVIAANNIIIGGRADTIHRYMSNGIFIVGLKNCEILNNYVFRTAQNALQVYGLDRCVIQDNDFEATGGGGNATVLLNNVSNSMFRRNHFRSRPGLAVSTQPGIVDKCGKGNVFQDNRTDGAVTPPTPVCP
jgi:hypothetical protein